MDYRTTFFAVIALILIPVYVSADVCFQPLPYDEGSLQGFGDTIPNMAASSFTVAQNATLDAIDARVRRNGGRTDNAFFSLWSSSAGSPLAEIEACSSPSIGSSFQWATSTCAGTYEMQPGVTYFVVADAATNEGNNFHLANGAAGNSWDYVSGTWGTGNNSGLYIAMQVYCTPVGGGGSSSSATSTDDYSQPHKNLQNGIILLMIGFFGMVWLIRKH